VIEAMKVKENTLHPWSSASFTHITDLNYDTLKIKKACYFVTVVLVVSENMWASSSLHAFLVR